VSLIAVHIVDDSVEMPSWSDLSGGGASLLLPEAALQAA